MATPPADALPGAITHDDQTEGYYIVSGGGTAFIDGHVVNGRHSTSNPDGGPNGPGCGGLAVGSRKVELKVGDVLIVPPGVIHGWADIPDHVDLIAKTASGAPVSVQVLAGVPAEDANFVFEIRGSDGWLRLTGNHLAGVQVGDLTVSASVEFDALDVPVATGVGPTAAPFWAGAAINVGEVYASLGRDLVAGTYQTPGFAHALHNSRLVQAVERAAQTGERQSILA